MALQNLLLVWVELCYGKVKSLQVCEMDAVPWKKELQCPWQLRGVSESLFDMLNVEQLGGRMKTSMLSFLPGWCCSSILRLLVRNTNFMCFAKEPLKMMTAWLSSSRARTRPTLGPGHRGPVWSLCTWSPHFKTFKRRLSLLQIPTQWPWRLIPSPFSIQRYGGTETLRHTEAIPLSSPLLLIWNAILHIADWRLSGGGGGGGRGQELQLVSAQCPAAVLRRLGQ